MKDAGWNYSGDDSGMARNWRIHAAVLDACWLYGDKEKIKVTYMQPIVMSTTYGEREGR